MVDKTQNNTDTELQILKSIEQAFYKNNPQTQKRNTDKSLKWFSTYVPRAYNKTRTSQIMRDQSLFTDKLELGKMYFMYYDPIHKATLPVYDRFPMFIPFEVFAKNGYKYMLGINLHYLPPALRFEAFKALLRFRNEKRYRRSTKLKFEWQLIKSLSTSKLFMHSVKMYRMDHIRSKFIFIPPKAYELVMFLPLARFEKGGKAEAWKIK